VKSPFLIATWLLSGVALAYIILPLLVVVISALGNTDFLAFPPRGLTLRHFGDALADPRYTRAFLTSLAIAVTAAALATVIGLMAAVALTRFRVPGASVVEAVLLSPLVLPAITLALALTLLFSRFGVPAGNWRLVVVHQALCVPYVVRVTVPILRRLDPAQEEAARNLGASPLIAFLLVALPAIRPGAIAAATFAFIASFDELELALFLADPRAPTLPVTIYSAIQLGVDPTVAAVSALLVILAGVGMLAYQSVAGGRRA
jgi:putative spermidine/putrescine transport system permease protein